MIHNKKAKFSFILAGFTIIAILFLFSREAMLTLIKNANFIPKVIINIDKSKSTTPQRRPVPDGFIEFRNEKNGYQILYPDSGYSLCFNEIDCETHDGNISYVSVVPDEYQDKMSSYFFRIEKLGSSIGIAPSDFANMIRRVNEKAGLFVEKSENEIKVSGSTGYQFAVQKGFEWNGYTTDGEFIKVDAEARNQSNSGFVYDENKILNIVYFSQNDELFQIIYEKGSPAELIIKSVAFSWY